MVEIAVLLLQALSKIYHTNPHFLGKEHLGVIVQIIKHTRGLEEGYELNSVLYIGSELCSVTSRGCGVKRADAGIIEVSCPLIHLISVESIELTEGCGNITSHYRFKLCPALG